MSLSIFIRTDSSQKIGSGHVMRCLALSEELRDAGAVVEFVTHNHQGNINKQIKNKGFNVNLLSNQIKLKLSHKLTEYEQYLGITQEVDADKTIQILKSKEVDLLIIDHYALDIKWEERIRPYTRKVMVIDDLANRNHNCDLLLDQNYIYDKTRYNNILKSRTIKLLGPRYALLRRNFEENKKRHNINFNNIRRVFVFFGGADLDNLTNVTLQALSQPKLKHLVADVVVGSSYPYKDMLKIEIDKHPNATLYTQIDNIAELMVKSDIAIGAGGTTTWERLALGVPSIVVTVADNQVVFTKYLDRDGYLKWLGKSNQIDKRIIYNAILKAINNSDQLRIQAEKGQELVDGLGVKRTVNLLLKLNRNSTYKERKDLFFITILSDRKTWMDSWIDKLLEDWLLDGHQVNWVNKDSEVSEGDFCFILSYEKIIKPNILKLNKHNLVVHASNLPEGKGMSPLSWQILEGKNNIKVTLFEAKAALDAGDIYLQKGIVYKGHELLDGLRSALAKTIIKLCNQFVIEYPKILHNACKQSGKESFYIRRKPEDSRIDVDKSLSEQFQLLRIVDNNEYPAFFELNDHKYILKIEKYDKDQ